MMLPAELELLATVIGIAVGAGGAFTGWALVRWLRGLDDER